MPSAVLSNKNLRIQQKCSRSTIHRSKRLTQKTSESTIKKTERTNNLGRIFRLLSASARTCLFLATDVCTDRRTLCAGLTLIDLQNPYPCHILCRTMYCESHTQAPLYVNIWLRSDFDHVLSACMRLWLMLILPFFVKGCWIEGILDKRLAEMVGKGSFVPSCIYMMNRGYFDKCLAEIAGSAGALLLVYIWWIEGNSIGVRQSWRGQLAVSVWVFFSLWAYTISAWAFFCLWAAVWYERASCDVYYSVIYLWYTWSYARFSMKRISRVYITELKTAGLRSLSSHARFMRKKYIRTNKWTKELLGCPVWGTKSPTGMPWTVSREFLAISRLLGSRFEGTKSQPQNGSVLSCEKSR